MPFEFVDTYDPPNELVELPEPQKFYMGMPVIIFRGKHEGKTGKVAVMERTFVRILEDETSIEVSLIICS